MTRKSGTGRSRKRANALARSSKHAVLGVLQAQQPVGQHGDPEPVALHHCCRVGDGAGREPVAGIHRRHSKRHSAGHEIGGGEHSGMAGAPSVVSMTEGFGCTRLMWR